MLRAEVEEEEEAGAMGRLVASSSGPRSPFRRATFFYHVNKIFSDSRSPALAKQTNKPLATTERSRGLVRYVRQAPPHFNMGQTETAPSSPLIPRPPARESTPGTLSRAHTILSVQV